jgi:predicted amidohydrolase
MVVDPLGEGLYEAAHKEDVHTITLDKDKLEEIRKRFPFGKTRTIL